MDPNMNGAHFLPPNVNPFVVPRFTNPSDYTPVGTMTGPTSHIYQPPPSIQRAGEPQSSEYPPITPPHLTHSRRGSRESGETSSSNSTPSSSSLVHRHKRGHASGSNISPSSPIAARKSRKVAKKKEEEEEEEDAMSEDDAPGGPKLRRDDAKKSRQDAEQKRRDQLKGAYDQLRGTIPGTTEKTSKVVLVNHARQYIVKLTAERERLRHELSESQKELTSLQRLNERLMEKLAKHNIDFQEDLRATHMEIPPDDEPQQGHSATVPPAPSQAAPPLAPAPAIASSQTSQPAPVHASSGPHRPGHIRTSSNISATQYPMQPPMGAGMPMSAPPHTSSLPEFAQLPISTPASPQKATLGIPTNGSHHPQQGVPPPLNMSFMGMHPMSSPSSSASSSAPRQSIYSPEGNLVYSDDPSSSDSFPRSAMSSQVNVAHLSLQEQQALRHQHGPHGSAPHSPSQAIPPFNQGYIDPSAPYRPEVQYGIGASYGNPGLGLNMPGSIDGLQEGYNIGPDINGVPPIPGAFPHDDGFSYQHTALRQAVLQPPQTFDSSVGVMYGGPQDQTLDYSQPSISFSQDPGLDGHPAGDAFLTSPIPHGSPSGHQMQYPGSQNGGVQHLGVSSPHHLEPSGHSPVPLRSPLGSYPDLSSRPDAGSSGVDAPNGATASDKQGEGGWFQSGGSFPHS